ncbi:amidohydrolase [Xenophilus azovorans]|uniref:amidohydrolase n=1 Tax=Xenophilus azovorans TaxID=151755 RepID=UPI00146FF8FE|nr:amidohydrolase family protein [Xenophilus azovorans]
MHSPAGIRFSDLIAPPRASAAPAIDRAADGAKRLSPACLCTASRENFLSRVVESDRHRIAPDGDWRRPRRLTRPLDWTCAADAWHAMSKQADDAALSDGAPAAVVSLVRWLQQDGEGIAAPADASPGVPPSPSRHAAACESSEDDEILLRGGRIFTNDPDQPWCDALLVRGRRIVAAGTGEALAMQVRPGARVVELAGRTVIPGFNDAHMHHTPDPTGVRLPIDHSLSWDEAHARIAEACAAAPPGTWIFGTMSEAVTNARDATRTVLDRIAPKHPVILLGITNHTNVVNTEAMRRLGIDDRAPDPVGGWFERVPPYGRLNGRIHEYAQWAPQRCFASMASVEEGAASLRTLGAECLRLGITTLQNMSWTPVRRYVQMLDAAALPIRVRVIRFPPSGPAGRLVHEDIDVGAPASPLVTVEGTKWILDGTWVERGAALGRGYADAPWQTGRENFSRAEIMQMLAESLRSGEHLLLHAIGTATIESVLCCLEAFEPPVDWKQSGFRLEHGDGFTDVQMPRARRLGVLVVQNPSHFVLAGQYASRFGTGTRYASFGSLFANGMDVAIGSDGPLNPFLGIWAATTHPANPEEAVDRETAVAAYTWGSAVAEGLQAEKGRLAPGYLADLAVLSADIFSVPAERLPGIESQLTMVDGRIAYESPVR